MPPGYRRRCTGVQATLREQVLPSVRSYWGWHHHPRPRGCSNQFGFWRHTPGRGVGGAIPRMHVRKLHHHPTTNYSQFGFWGHTYGRVSLLPVVEACVVVRGRVCEVRVASTTDEAEAIIMIVDLTLSYIWRLGNYFVRRLHYAASRNFLGGGPADQNNSKYF